MLLMPTLQAINTTNPLVIVLAIIGGLVAFFVFRTVFRALNLVFHLGCLVIVAGTIFLILRNMIK